MTALLGIKMFRAFEIILFVFRPKYLRVSTPFLFVHIELQVFTTAGLPVSYKLGVRWHFCWRGTILNLGPVLDSSAQTTRGDQLDFVVKPKNSLV